MYLVNVPMGKSRPLELRRIHLLPRPRGGPQPGAEPEERLAPTPAVTAERLHGCVIDQPHRCAKYAAKIKTDPTLPQMFWISDDSSLAHGRGKTNRRHIEFPAAHVLRESCHKLFRPHSGPRRKLALVTARP